MRETASAHLCGECARWARTLEDLRNLVSPQIAACCDLRSVLDLALSWCLRFNGTTLGNVQLMDYKLRSLVIAAHRGFAADFASRFARVDARDGTACGRVIRNRCCIIVEDVFSDREFSPYRATAAEFGFRAVQVVPLLSLSGAFLGVMSTHFPLKHCPTDQEIQATKLLAGLTANAIIRERARGRIGARGTEQQIAEARGAVRSSWALLRQTSKI